MEEISTSFCFICLLHLANEQGLKLESSPDGKLPNVVENPILDELEDVLTTDKKVGNLWDLKVGLSFPFSNNDSKSLTTSFCRCTEIRMPHRLHNGRTMLDRAGFWVIYFILFFRFSDYYGSSQLLSSYVDLTALV